MRTRRARQSLVLRLAGEGKGPSDIARLARCSRPTVYSDLKELGVSIRKVVDPIRMQILKDFGAGESCKAISRKYGKSISVIYFYINKAEDRDALVVQHRLNLERKLTERNVPLP